MAIRRISIMSVPVSDQHAAKDSYMNVLGFTLIRDNPMGQNARWIQLSPLPGEAAPHTALSVYTWTASSSSTTARLSTSRSAFARLKTIGGLIFSTLWSGPSVLISTPRSRIRLAI